MRERMKSGVGYAWKFVTSAFAPIPTKHSDQPDMSRRLVLAGAAAVACTAAFSLAPSPVSAQPRPDEYFFFGGGHSRDRSRWHHDRRRSYMDSHSRRRSRDAHSRDRSRGHGRNRSRREYRDWNENCFLSPFGWFCF
jgi:hypothetical protein